MANAFLEKPPASNDGGWPTTPENAYVNDNQYAITTTTSDTCVYYNFDFSDIPGGSVIGGIRVRINGDWHDPGSTDITSPTFDVELTWNGSGSPTWTTAKTTKWLAEDDEQELYVGGPSDTWGHAWTLAEVQDTDDFRLRVTSKSTGVTGSPQWRIDYIEVAVYYYESTGQFFDSVGFGEDIHSSIIPVHVHEALQVADGGSQGALKAAPNVGTIGKAGTAITTKQSSSATVFDTVAKYNREEGCVVCISFAAGNDAQLYIGDAAICASPEDPSPIVQLAQPGLISIDSITYSSDFGSPQKPAFASIRIANKKYGNVLGGLPIYMYDYMVEFPFLGSEVIVYAMARSKISDWAQRVIFRGSISNVSLTDEDVTISAVQLGHGDIPVPDQKITDDTFYYAENMYGGQAGREGNKIDEKMGAVIPIGLGRFDIYAVEGTWQTGHSFAITQATTPVGVYAQEKTARGIVPAMMGVKFPMMPCVAAVRNWTGRHTDLSESGGKISGRLSHVYQQVYLHGSRKGWSSLYVSHGTPDDYYSYIMGDYSGYGGPTKQGAFLLPIYTWDSNVDRALPFVRDTSARATYIFNDSSRFSSLRSWSSAGSMDAAVKLGYPSGDWTDGEARQAFGMFVNISPTADSSSVNLLTILPNFPGALQAMAIPFESISKLEGWCVLQSYFDGFENHYGVSGASSNKTDMLRPKELNASTTINFDDTLDAKGQIVYQVPNSVPSAGKIWGVRVGGIWNPEAGTPGQIEMYGRYAGPYDFNPNHSASSNPNYRNGWPFFGRGQDYDLAYMFESVNVAIAPYTGLDGTTHCIRVVPSTGYRYFSWWIRPPWYRSTRGVQGPLHMVTPEADPNSGNQGMTAEWEFMSWGWDDGVISFLLKFPWEVRFGCRQTGASDESVVLNKAWLETIFHSKVTTEKNLPKAFRDYPDQPSNVAWFGSKRVDDPFAYLWRKGIYPTQQQEAKNSDDIFITGVGPTIAGTVIEKPSEQAQLLIAHYAGMAPTTGSTFGSFDTAGTSQALKMSLVVNTQKTLAQVLGDIARQSYAIIEEQIDENGEIAWRAFVDTDDPATDAPERIYRSDISFEFTPKDIVPEGDFRTYTTEREQLTSDIRLRYGWHIPSGTWSGEIYLNRNGTNLDTDGAAYVTAAQQTYDDYNQLENPQTHDLPDVWSKSSADAVLKWLFNKQRRRLTMVDFPTYIRHTDLRIGHVIKIHDSMEEVVGYIGDDGGPDWSDHLFTVLGISYSKDVDGFLRVQVLAQETFVPVA